MTTGPPASLLERLEAFIAADVLPNEAVYREQLESAPSRWAQPPIMDALQRRARAQGLWNLFQLANRAYAPLCEAMGHSLIAPEVFNCSPPDTGNMEVLARYGTPEQQERWLRPLLEGEIRSGFAMTEPGVASSDATNIAAEIRRDGDAYALNGRKWWTTGAAHPRCKVLIFLGRSDPRAPRHQQHTMLIVPLDTPGVRVVRRLSVFGYDEAPHGHCEIAFEDARVPCANVLLGEGRGFEIGQGRLGPGRLHHCLRSIGRAERALELMVRRARERVAFGKPLADQGVVRTWIADSRIEIDAARLLTYDAAERLDREGNKAARHAIAAAKVVAPNVALRVIDRAIQAFGAAGVSSDTFLAEAYAYERTLRLADGPDEVHRDAIARAELKKVQA
ncbi:MAG: acyl-CoA dehydrogenase family protein [Candidatus Eremiobacteraeota bacterium]|nr:acyl-CoA dehydrogenase family protein [Candidatus Eremiobacteraeota bacterium]